MKLLRGSNGPLSPSNFSKVKYIVLWMLMCPNFVYNFKTDTYPLHARHCGLQTQYPFFLYSLQTELQFWGSKWGQLKNLYFPSPPCREQWPLRQFWPMRYKRKLLNGLLQKLLKKGLNQLDCIFCPFSLHFHFFPSGIKTKGLEEEQPSCDDRTNTSG